MFLIDNKTGNPPPPVPTIVKREFSIPWATINPRKLLPGPVLAPSYRFLPRIDKYPVSTSFLDKLSLLQTIPHCPLGPSPRFLFQRHRSSSLMVHAPAPQPISHNPLFQEEPFKIRPSPD